MKVRVEGRKNIKGEIEVPGDKSISHRALIAGLLAKGDTEITNILRSEDTMATENFLRMLSAEVIHERDRTIVRSKGMFGLKEPEDVMNALNSGTTARLFTGILSGCNFFSVITGDSSLRRRPMRRVTEPLRMMGAKIEGRCEGDLLPLSIRGGKLNSIKYELKIPSAQVKSAIILAGLFVEGETEIHEPVPSRDHTERMLPQFGADIKKDGNTIRVRGGKVLNPSTVRVPGDFSSAAFFITLGVINSGGEIVVKNVTLNPTRTGLLKILERMGADIKVENVKTVCGEEMGDIIARNREGLRGTVVKGEEIPLTIDELPLVALAGCFAEGETVIRDAQELRKKESDRIATTVSELKKMGAEIEELEDGMIVRGPVKLKGARVTSHGDHRIAMLLYIAGLCSEGITEIENFDSVNISFPTFTSVAESLIK